MQLYHRVCREKNSSLNTRCRASAGIRLRFKTNSQKLKMTVEISKCTSRTCFSFDVFVNGNAIGYLENTSQMEVPAVYTEAELPQGPVGKEFVLGDGDKEVCVPALVCLPGSG